MKTANLLFGKDGYIRHFSQHLIIALASYYMVTTIFQIPSNTNHLLIFLFFTYVIDIDGLIALFRMQDRIPEAKDAVNSLKKLEIKKFILIATKEHKKLKRLFIHNIIGYMLIAGSFVYFVSASMDVGLLAAGAVLTHLTFDIIDDLYQLGHVQNWLWQLNEAFG
jgi:hypothetical protein